MTPNVLFHSRAPLALALSLVLVAGLASPDAIAAKKKKSAKPKEPAAPTACTDR